MAAHTSVSHHCDHGYGLTKFREKNLRIIEYLTSGSYVGYPNENQKRVVRSQAKNYIYDEAKKELYYTGKYGDIRKKVVTEVEEVADILKQYHFNPMGGHSGINGTLSKISQNYVWSGMKQDVMEYIKSCDRCQTQQKFDKIKTKPPKLKQVKAVEPLEVVGLDLIGPLPISDDGYKYVLTFTDYFTKFVEFFPLKSKEASGIAACIKTFVCRWGAPKKMLSDQGKQSVAKINDEVCKQFDIIRPVVISAHHPQTFGFDERTTQTLKVRLSKLVNEHQDDWTQFLEEVAYSIRTQKQSSTRYSPFFLMFGRHPRSPLEMDPVDEEELYETDQEAMNSAIDEMVARRELSSTDVNAKVLLNVGIARARQKKGLKRRKSAGVKTFDFAVGDSWKGGEIE